MFLSCKHGHLIPYGKAKTRLGFRGHLKCPQLKKMRKILARAFFPQSSATPLFPEDSSYYTSVDMSWPWQRGWTWWSLRSLPTILWFCGICTENTLEQVFTVSVNMLFLRITAWLHFSSSNNVYLHLKNTSHISFLLCRPTLTIIELLFISMEKITLWSAYAGEKCQCKDVNRPWCCKCRSSMSIC